MATRKPDAPDFLSLAAYHILSLTKLRAFGAAADALATLHAQRRLHLDDEDTGTDDGDESRRVFPYALRVLHAELPHCVGKTQLTVDRHVALVHHCARHVMTSQDGRGEDASSSSHGASTSTSTWRRRRDAAVVSVVNRHVATRDFIGALTWLDYLARRTPPPHRAAVLVTAGRVHLAMGDIEGAEMCFTAAETETETETESASGVEKNVLSPDAWINRGLVACARRDYSGAQTFFESVRAVRPWDPVANNNAAVAALYCGNLRGALGTLEHALSAHPASCASSESCVLNTCALYELSAPTPAAAKRTLGQVGHLQYDDGCFTSVILDTPLYV